MSDTAAWLPSMSADDHVNALERAMSDVFSVHVVTVRERGSVVRFEGQFLRAPELVFAALNERFRALGALPQIRREGATDVVIARRLPPPAGAPRVRINVILLVLTAVCTIGAGMWMDPQASAVVRTPADLARLVAAHWTRGVPFAAALMGILGVHELGHYFAARRHGLDVTLPYFLPFPINPLLGTLGAVIAIRSPFQSRRALFDVGVAGPLAGMAVAVPVVLAGLARTRLIPTPPAGPGVGVFNEPLLLQWLARAVVGPRPHGMDIELNALLMAGWWGFFLTALNLLPTSQLDGGHVVAALLGERHVHVARLTLALTLVVGVVASTPPYLVLGFLALLMGVRHPPALDDVTPLGRGRRLLGVGVLVLFLLLFTPSPFPGWF